MSKDAKAMDVKIMGRDFRVSVADAERDQLLRAVAYLDQKMCSIRDAGKVVGTERIAVMAALNIAHELLTMKVPGSSYDAGEVTRRITAMQSAIDSTLASQDELF
jgi:cell division protein ZapA